MEEPTKWRTERRAGGAMSWLLHHLGAATRPHARLAVVERVALAPRQSLVLVEAEGRRLLVAMSAEGAAAFYALDRPSEISHDDEGRGAVELKGYVC
jgi:flagellar biogenesis protein FliO